MNNLLERKSSFSNMRIVQLADLKALVRYTKNLIERFIEFIGMTTFFCVFTDNNVNKEIKFDIIFYVVNMSHIQKI